MKLTDNDNADSADELQKQARHWVRLLSSDEIKSWDYHAFRRWLAMSESHQAAFDEAKQRWDVLKSAVGELLHTRPEVAAYHHKKMAGPDKGRRVFIGAAVGMAALAGIEVVRSPFDLGSVLEGWNADYQTATGEQKTVDVTQSVQVTLNTQTRLRKQTLNENIVGLELVSGEAAINVAGKGGAFAVSAGTGRCTVNAGQFEMRYLDGKVRVACIEGVVQVAHPAGLRTLQARQQAVYSATAISDVNGVDVESVNAWRKGELLFHEIRLTDAITEINRYRSGRVVLLNSAAGNRLVSGRFSVTSLDLALSQLQLTFNLHARELPGGLLFLS
jgi:transmembrane sensor